MKPLLFVVNEQDKDTVVVEKDRLDRMLRLVYEEGYKDGKNEKTIQFVPYDYGYPGIPTQMPEVTCENNSSVKPFEVVCANKSETEGSN